MPSLVLPLYVYMVVESLAPQRLTVWSRCRQGWRVVGGVGVGKRKGTISTGRGWPWNVAG